MRALSRTAMILLAMLPITPATGADRTDMLGKWTWQQFTIEVSECAAKGVCSKVIAGPKNVGLEIFASELVQRDGDWFGQIINPETRGNLQYTHALHELEDLASRRLHDIKGLPKRRVSQG